MGTPEGRQKTSKNFVVIMNMKSLAFACHLLNDIGRRCPANSLGDSLKLEDQMSRGRCVFGDLVLSGWAVTATLDKILATAATLEAVLALTPATLTSLVAAAVVTN